MFRPDETVGRQGSSVADGHPDPPTLPPSPQNAGGGCRVKTDEILYLPSVTLLQLY